MMSTPPSKQIKLEWRFAEQDQNGHFWMVSLLAGFKVRASWLVEYTKFARSATGQAVPPYLITGHSLAVAQRRADLAQAAELVERLAQNHGWNPTKHEQVMA